MLHTKFQHHRTSGFGEEFFLNLFTIYGPGGHLSHVTWPIYIGSVRGPPNGAIGNFTNGTIGLPMVPLGDGRANGTIEITIGTNAITNGTIGRTLNDIGIPLVPMVEP